MLDMGEGEKELKMQGALGYAYYRPQGLWLGLLW
jgi:hypothetical protein